MCWADALIPSILRIGLCCSRNAMRAWCPTEQGRKYPVYHGAEKVLNVKNLQDTNKAAVIRFLKKYLNITGSTLIVAVGVYFFRFPNDFTFGGVSGLSVVLGKLLPFTPGTINLAISVLLLILGLMVLGRKFAADTIYASLLLSFSISFLEKIAPLPAPLTDEPMLELVFAVLLPAVGSALLFNMGASSGGTDIVAMILRKYTSLNIGNALFFSDFLITCSAAFVFDTKTLLFSFLGLLTKSLIIDNVIESIHRFKYLNVICSNPEPICMYITQKLHRSATVCEANGAFSKQHKYLVLTVMKRSQAILLRKFVRETEKDAFIIISSTSEIIGKGFPE